jgi:hypothetical protein
MVGPGQQPGSHQGHRTVQHGTAATAAAAGLTSSIQGPGVPFLQMDIPLFINPAHLQLPTTPPGGPGSEPRSGAVANSSSGGGSSGGGGDGSNLPVPMSLLQLQHIYVRTPPAPFKLASRPRVCFSWLQQQTGSTSSAAAVDVHAAAPDAAAGPGGMQVTIGSRKTGSSSSSDLVFECAANELLPSDALVVINLPKVYAAPRQLLQTASPAAAAIADDAAVKATAAAQADVPLGVNREAALGSAATNSDSAVAAHRQAMPSSYSQEVTSRSDGTQHVQSGPSSTSCPATGSSQDLLPLLPVQPIIQGSAGGAAAAAGSAGGWSAVLCTQSWLYPVV